MGKGKDGVSLFDVPEPDVYNKHLWPLLSLNDLLRVRRVGYAGKLAIDDYLKSSPNRIPQLEIEINEDWKSLKTLLKFGICHRIKSVYINNLSLGLLFFRSSVVLFDKYLKRHSQYIIKLKVHTLSINPSREENQFLNRFGNLQELKVLNWVEDLGRSPEWTCMRTRIYRHLLQIASTGNSKNICQTMHLSMESANRINCPKLISLTVPVGVQTMDAAEVRFSFDYAELMEKLHYAVQPYRYLNGVRIKTGTPHPTLKNITFEYIKFSGSRRYQTGVEKTMSKPFIAFLEDVFEIDGFTMDMVNANWFACASGDIHSGAKITSMINLNPIALVCANFENLKRLDVITSESNILYQRYIEQELQTGVQRDHIKLFPRQHWSFLESINLLIDSDNLAECKGVIQREDGFETHLQFLPLSISFLFKYLFHGRSTESLAQLSIDFQHVPEWKPTQASITDIVTSCPNIKKLGLTNWTGTNKSLTVFWEGLTKLEEVTLKSCSTIGNVGFVGTDIESPVFLRLAHLKTLSLLDLHQMPKISDTFFKLVLSRMKLTKLVITSTTPMTNITVAGIQSLLQGDFADYIEKFSFTEWSIEGCASEVFDNLKRAFRAHYML